LLIDHDVVKIANLNRIFYATIKDALERRPKVEILKERIEGMGPGCTVNSIIGSILDNDVLHQLNQLHFPQLWVSLGFVGYCESSRAK
jgi:tRNA A37 threonylcarbamoyladenosine dehydratase